MVAAMRQHYNGYSVSRLPCEGATVKDLAESGVRPALRSFIRQQVRQGRSVTEIRDALELRFGGDDGRIGRIAPTFVTRMIQQESRRQQIISRLERQDKTRRTNLHTIVGCGAGETIQTRITLHWHDPQTERDVVYGHTTTLRNQGRLMDILNPAIREAIMDAIGRGYTPPNITSSMLTGGTRYRIEYVECV